MKQQKDRKHMAPLQQLIPYLRKGYTLQAANGETLTPSVSSSRQLVITSARPETKERVFWPQEHALGEISLRGSIWDHGVVFLDENKKPVVLTRIEAIEQAVQEKKPHTTFGREPKEQV
jgi:hypothetical protein